MIALEKALLICDSQTEALALKRVLAGGGVSGWLVRPPRDAQTRSCAYAVRIDRAELPQAQATRDVKATPDLIKVTVTEKGDLFVNGHNVGPGGLRSALQTAAKENPDRRVRLDGDVYAPFRSVVQVLDACQQEKLTVVGIHTADGAATASMK